MRTWVIAVGAFAIAVATGWPAGAVGLYTGPAPPPLTDPAEPYSSGIVAAFGQGLADNPTPRLLRAAGATLAETGTNPFDETGQYTRPEPTMDPATANATYGIKGVLNFDQPIPESVAKDLYEHARDKLFREDTMQRAGVGGLAKFTTGIAASLLDPIHDAIAVVFSFGAYAFVTRLWPARRRAERISEANQRASEWKQPPLSPASSTSSTALKDKDNDRHAPHTKMYIMGAFGFIVAFALTFTLEAFLFARMEAISGRRMMPIGLGWIAAPFGLGIVGWHFSRRLDPRALIETGFNRLSSGASFRLPVAIYASWTLSYASYLLMAERQFYWYGRNIDDFWLLLLLPPTVCTAVIFIFRWARNRGD